MIVFGRNVWSNRHPAFDGKKNLYSSGDLPVGNDGPVSRHFFCIPNFLLLVHAVFMLNLNIPHEIRVYCVISYYVTLCSIKVLISLEN